MANKLYDVMKRCEVTVYFSVMATDMDEAWSIAHDADMDDTSLTFYERRIADEHVEFVTESWTDFDE